MKDMQKLNGADRAIKCAGFALDKKGYEVRILEIGYLSSIADFMVIATGKSEKQVQAIAESVRVGMKKFDMHIDIEGMQDGKWVVIDYGDIIFHVFIEELRTYYDLDGLWTEAPELPVPAALLWEGNPA